MVAPELAEDGDDFWRGAKLRCFDAQRQLIDSAVVVTFRSIDQTLTCDRPIPRNAVGFELDSGLEAPVLAVRRLLQCGLERPLPPISVRLGTTRGTNALLTRRGAKTVLAITASLEDLMLIGDQTRPRLFDLAIRRDDQLAAMTIGIQERLAASGEVLQALNEDAVRADLKRPWMRDMGRWRFV